MKIAIIGAGFGGIGAAIRLRKAGFDDIVILERGHDVGGVWRDNTYPGCACDVQSHLYSFSFAPNPKWSHSYSGQPEIYAYLKRVADDYGIRPLVRFNTSVKSASWEHGRWRIETNGAPVFADALVAAIGGLSEPSTPNIEGLDRFRGKAMHTARWDHSVDLAGKRVAVIGTGASAIQVVPAIQPMVDKLTIFQRTPAWIIPRAGGDIPTALQKLYASLPVTQRLVRGAIAVYREMFIGLFLNKLGAEKLVRRHALGYLKKVVKDPALREKLTPNYAVGCKRILLTNDYLPAVVKPNVEVITDSIRRVTENSIVDASGREHIVDTIILSTGFHVTDPPLAKHVRGRLGLTMAEAWNGSMKAHLGTSVHGFPNYFFVLGPNTGLGHTSVLEMMEPQFEHIAGALEHMRRHGLRAIEPTKEAQDAFVAHVDRRMQGTVWTSGGCKSWYLDVTGRNSTLWPGTTVAYARRVSRFRPEEYQAVPEVALGGGRAPALQAVSP